MTSAKRIVASLRSSAAGCAPAGVPHDAQKRSPALTGAPQVGHTAVPLMVRQSSPASVTIEPVMRMSDVLRQLRQQHSTADARPRLMERYAAFLPVDGDDAQHQPGRGLHAARPRAQPGPDDRLPDAPSQGRGHEPDRLVQGSRHGRRRGQGDAGRVARDHLRLDRKHGRVGSGVRRRGRARGRGRPPGRTDRRGQAAPGTGRRRARRRGARQLRCGA